MGRFGSGRRRSPGGNTPALLSGPCRAQPQRGCCTRPPPPAEDPAGCLPAAPPHSLLWFQQWRHSRDLHGLCQDAHQGHHHGGGEGQDLGLCRGARVRRGDQVTLRGTASLPGAHPTRASLQGTRCATHCLGSPWEPLLGSLPGGAEPGSAALGKGQWHARWQRCARCPSPGRGQGGGSGRRGLCLSLPLPAARLRRRWASSAPTRPRCTSTT